MDASLAELAEFVTGGLADAGIPRCKGDAMATHPAMRRSLEGWIEALETWRHDLSPSGSILSSIVYDFRRVTGPLDPEPELEAAIREAGRDPAFLRHLAHRALADRPPTGFLRDLVVERKGEHAGRFDVKHGGITIIGNIARLEGVKAGIPAKETLDRLAGAAAAGHARTGRTPTSSRRRSRSSGRCACATRRIRCGAESRPTTSSIRQRSGRSHAEGSRRRSA